MEEQVTTRVLLADDHELVRQGLKLLLEREGFHVVGEVSDGQMALQSVLKVCPDVAIFDIGMPILNGLDAARELRKTSPRTKTILLTRHDEEQYVTEALRAGVKGYVLKNQAATDLVYAVQQVSRGEIYLSPSISRTVAEAFLSKTGLPPDPLTSRERQVLQLIGEGRSSKEIATQLGISTKTAESHRTRLMQKLDIHDVASLVRYAIRRGLVVL
jgi:DNA-binding NarL/FixJ family response regulator